MSDGDLVSQRRRRNMIHRPGAEIDGIGCTTGVIAGFAGIGSACGSLVGCTGWVSGTTVYRRIGWPMSAIIVLLCIKTKYDMVHFPFPRFGHLLPLRERYSRLYHGARHV